MSVELKWESRQLLTIHYRGEVSGPDLLDTSLRISGDARFDDLRYVLSDWSKVDKANVTKKDVRVLVAYVSAMARTNDYIKNAVVVTSDGIGRSLGSFYKELTADISWQIKYFGEEHEARNWFKQES